jgi:hypothetical protein
LAPISAAWFNHQLESVLAGLFTEARQQRDVSADQRLQAGADGAEDRARAHHDAAHYTEIAHDLVAIQGESGSHHVFRDESGSGTVNWICHETILIDRA